MLSETSSGIGNMGHLYPELCAPHTAPFYAFFVCYPFACASCVHLQRLCVQTHVVGTQFQFMSDLVWLINPSLTWLAWRHMLRPSDLPKRLPDSKSGCVFNELYLANSAHSNKAVCGSYYADVTISPKKLKKNIVLSLLVSSLHYDEIRWFKLSICLYGFVVIFVRL